MPADTHSRPFPFGVVQDLLGVTRALYRAERDADLPESYERLRRLEEAGKAFRQALDLARPSGPGTMGRRAAWNWAEKGAALLGDVVRDQAELANLVRVSAVAIGRRR